MKGSIGVVLIAAAASWGQPLLAADAAEPVSRSEALGTLASKDAAERIRAVIGLAVNGRMEDAPRLIAALRDEDQRVRTTAEQALWALWSRSGDPRIDALLRKGVEQMDERRFAEAIEIFTRIVESKPDFAEGWNKRATAYFLAGNYRRSLRDCDEVLKRNPQHFGVLSGYGQIYLQLGEPEKALAYFRRALAVNPNLDGIDNMIEKLESFMERRRARTI